MKKNIILEKRKTGGMHKHLSQQYDMIVFCHLRWNFVYQRPQHLLSRLAKIYSILVVEEPIPIDGKGDYEMEIISPNLSILRPKVQRLADIKQVLQQLNLFEFQIAWFYSAAFVKLLPAIDASTIIYDCMDELSQFKGASNELKALEKILIEKADIIFTGGKSLYDAKSQYSNNVHCFPSSVDVEHFNKDVKPEEIPADLKSIPSPIIGYIGVIDERINLELLHKTAQLVPQASFVMIGPFAKIDHNDLPLEPNIFYLGMKSYNELPNYLKGFDIAMMPFALNEATQYISPTKTLEYIAAGRPIISTAIKDVVRDYSSVIDIIDTSSEFSKVITTLIDKDFEYDKTQYLDILKRTSWDTTAQKMIQLIKQKVK